ncbi:RING-type zinc-finger domain-containing protein [Ditylenchus destructor]|nr:RING-type zinc-finger domain-containing protein [Ditylenchus destructor]
MAKTKNSMLYRHIPLIAGGKAVLKHNGIAGGGVGGYRNSGNDRRRREYFDQIIETIKKIEKENFVPFTQTDLRRFMFAEHKGTDFNEHYEKAKEKMKKSPPAPLQIPYTCAFEVYKKIYKPMLYTWLVENGADPGFKAKTYMWDKIKKCWEKDSRNDGSIKLDNRQPFSRYLSLLSKEVKDLLNEMPPEDGPEEQVVEQEVEDSETESLDSIRRIDSEDELELNEDDDDVIMLDEEVVNEVVPNPPPVYPMEKESLMEALSCPICLDIFPSARMLSCGHTFCLGCIRGCSESGTVRCPTCRLITLGRATQMPVNYVVQNMALEVRSNSASEYN